MSGVTTGLPVMSPPAARRGQVLVAEDDVRLGRLLAQSLTKADRTPPASIPEQRRINYGGLLADAYVIVLQRISCQIKRR